MMTSISTGKRSDIQALRGLAVLAVMFAHFGSIVPAGFLGVDLFFAISGFVITLSLIGLVNQAPSTSAALAQFWWRRLWRLLPALSAVLSATVLAAFLLLPPGDFFDQAEMAIWSFFFTGNVGVEVISQPDYFDPASQFNWLLHLWSLGVEEQFYLVFPWVMVALLPFLSSTQRWTRALSIFVGASLASLFIASLNDIEFAFFGSRFFADTTGISALVGYYSPLTRAWEFGIGVIAALLIRQNPGSTKVERWLSCLGGLLLAISFLLVPESNLLPGPITLLPMAGIFLLLRYRGTWVDNYPRLWKPLIWLGDRSYSAYLWHWPIWSVISLGVENTFAKITLAFLVTLALADRTHALIELPFIAWSKRDRPRLSLSRRLLPQPKKISATALLALPLLLVFSIQGTYSAMASQGIINQRQEVPQAAADVDCVKVDCSTQEIDVLVVGDSHAGTLTNALRQSLSDDGLSTFGAIVARHFGCPHLPSTRISSVFPECKDLAQKVRSIAADTAPKVVVIYGYTAGRFTTINSGGEQDISLIDNSTGIRVTEQTSISAYADSLAETVTYFSNLGSTVVIVSGTPDFTLRPEEVGQSGKAGSMAELMISPLTGAHSGQSVTREEFLARHGQFEAVEKEIANSRESVIWVNSWDVLCNQSTCSQIDDSGNLLYADQDHLSQLGSQILAEGVAKTIRTLGIR